MQSALGNILRERERERESEREREKETEGRRQKCIAVGRACGKEGPSVRLCTKPKSLLILPSPKVDLAR
jgi:hypothetical protein